MIIENNKGEYISLKCPLYTSDNEKLIHKKNMEDCQHDSFRYELLETSRSITSKRYDAIVCNNCNKILAIKDKISHQIEKVDCL